MIQDQPSPHFLKYQEQLLRQNSFNQYLPRQTGQIGLAPSTITKDNYIKMLEYCSSLERQVGQLKKKLKQQIECNKDLQGRHQRQPNLLVNSSNLLNSFHSVNRNQQRKGTNNSSVQSNDLTLHFQREMITMLKQENLVLTQKITKLYNENQRLLSQKIRAKEKKPTQSMDIGLPFNKINLSNNKQSHSKTMKLKGTNTKQVHLPPQELNQKLHLLHKKLINSNQSLFTPYF